MENQQKVLFVQDIGNNEIEIEGLWCEKVGEYYVIDNIPFIAKRVSLGDTIKVEYDDDESAYYFDEFVAVSGNSTVRLYINNNHKIPLIRKQLEKFGCETEVFLDRKIIGVNIPQCINYKPIKKFLEQGEQNGEWQYEESCLAHKL